MIFSQVGVLVYNPAVMVMTISQYLQVTHNALIYATGKR
jgi:hypothetical protein